MTTDAYRKAIAALEVQFAELQVQRADIQQAGDRIDQKLLQVEAALANLRAVIDEPDTEPYEGRLADAIREVMSRGGTLADIARGHLGRTPREVRDELRTLRYDLTQHTNPLASIHSVLKRMEEGGELLSHEDPQRGRAFYPARMRSLAAVYQQLADPASESRNASLKNNLPVTPRKYERIANPLPITLKSDKKK